MWSQDALTAHLRSIEGAEAAMSFAQLDVVVGSLSESARRHNAWWANSLRVHAHAKAWLDAGFTASPDFVLGIVRFTRGAPRTLAGGTDRTAPVRSRPPLVLAPSGEAHCSGICYTWLDASEIALENGRLAMPTLGPGPGVYRFDLRGVSGEVESYYVGESNNLFKRMNGYRNAGPSQNTNVRMSQRCVCQCSKPGIGPGKGGARVHARRHVARRRVQAGPADRREHRAGPAQTRGCDH